MTRICLGIGEYLPMTFWKFEHSQPGPILLWWSSEWNCSIDKQPKLLIWACYKHPRWLDAWLLFLCMYNSCIIMEIHIDKQPKRIWACYNMYKQPRFLDARMLYLCMYNSCIIMKIHMESVNLLINFSPCTMPMKCNLQKAIISWK